MTDRQAIDWRWFCGLGGGWGGIQLDKDAVGRSSKFHFSGSLTGQAEESHMLMTGSKRCVFCLTVRSRFAFSSGSGLAVRLSSPSGLSVTGAELVHHQKGSYSFREKAKATTPGGRQYFGPKYALHIVETVT